MKRKRGRVGKSESERGTRRDVPLSLSLISSIPCSLSSHQPGLPLPVLPRLPLFPLLYHLPSFPPAFFSAFLSPCLLPCANLHSAPALLSSSSISAAPSAPGFANSCSADPSCLSLLPVCPSLSSHSSLTTTLPISYPSHSSLPPHSPFLTMLLTSSLQLPLSLPFFIRLFLPSRSLFSSFSHSFSLFSSFPSHPLSRASLSPFLLFFSHSPHRLSTLLSPHPPTFFPSVSPASLFVCWQVSRGIRALWRAGVTLGSARNIEAQAQSPAMDASHNFNCSVLRAETDQHWAFM